MNFFLRRKNSYVIEIFARRKNSYVVEILRDEKILM